MIFLKILFNGWEYIKDMLMSKWYKSQMKKCGTNVSLHPSTSVYFGLNNLSLGSNVSIPRYAHIFCTDAPLTIGSNVIFGPAPTIVTGDHRIDVIGKPIFSSYDKLPENDAPVIIEDDVFSNSLSYSYECCYFGSYTISCRKITIAIIIHDRKKYFNR